MSPDQPAPDFVDAGTPIGPRTPGSASVAGLVPPEGVAADRRESPQFTVRAVATGLVLAGLLSICNVYVGLKTGLPPNMSIVAALLGFAFWGGMRGLRGRGIPRWGILENNISQTIGSSGSLVASAGLAAPIPALAMLSGQVLPWPYLSLWLFSVMLVGIAVAVPVRRQMIISEKLPFPGGIATAATLREMHAQTAVALTRGLALVSSGLVAAAVKGAQAFNYLGAYALPFSIRGYSAKALTFSLNPAPILVGIGGLIGFRATCSVLVGAVVAYIVASPLLLEHHYLLCQGTQPSYRELNAWLLWPGVTLMVVASMVSLCFSWRSVLSAWPGWSRIGTQPQPAREPVEIPRAGLFLGLLGVALLSVLLQVLFFAISWWVALIGVLLTLVLAVVAARVSGETGYTPVGPMGKVTQLLFGLLSPKNPVPNLMAANVTGGAASQCADLLDDLKCGHLLGASPRWLTLAQVLGALAGALVGSAGYLLLVPHPSELPTAEWAAPAAVIWKAVAEIFMVGLAALPRGTPVAIALATVAGVALPVLERVLPPRLRPLMASPISLGLGFVLPAEVALALFVGGLLALIAERWRKAWSTRFRVALCAGLIAGESVVGVVLAVARLLSG